MPGPVIYVACVIGTVAAVVAFKEFVYEPHIAPKFEAWSESVRRSRDRRSQGPVAVPAARQNENEARRRGSATPEDDSTSVELETLVARETAEWRSAASGSVPATTLRQRRTHDVMEESNVFIPYDPMAPTQVLFDTSDTESTRSFKSARSPATLPRSISPPAAHVPGKSSPRIAASNPPRSPSVSQARPRSRASPALPTPVSNMSPASSRATSPTNSQMYHSASSASSFTPAVIGPMSPRVVPSRASSRTASSIDAMSDVARSNPSSRVTSPFSDIHAAQAPSPAVRATSPNARSPLSDTSSPLILSPNIGSDYSLPSDTEDGMEGMVLSPSLRSGMFSPSVDLARDLREDPFDVGSETESWDSFGRRTPDL